MGIEIFFGDEVGTVVECGEDEHGKIMWVSYGVTSVEYAAVEVRCGLEGSNLRAKKNDFCFFLLCSFIVMDKVRSKS